MRRAGFTLIELMVSLVVAGILMAGLVSLSGSVQRAFARNKDITDLQANLRFAMKLVSDDFSRAGYMASPNPAWDTRVLIKPPNLGLSVPAIAFNPGSNSVILRGNYSSSSSITLKLSSSANFNTFKVVCRNARDFDPLLLCRNDTRFKPDYSVLPFGRDYSATPNYTDFNARRFDARFKKGSYIQIQNSDNTSESGWFRIATTNPALMEFTTTTSIVPTSTFRPQFDCFTISLIDEVTFSLSQDATYTPLFPTGTINRFRYLLQRTTSVTGGNQIQEVADFLTAPASLGSAAPGFELAVYNDTGAANANDNDLSRGNYIPNINYTTPPVKVTAAGDLSERSVRAVVITIRGRTESEDPDFSVTGIPADVGNFAVDLDGQPENGMAHVRVERSVVQLPNLAAGLGN